MNCREPKKPEAEKLCTNCGLCCQDVFHQFVYLETDKEVEMLKKSNFSLQYIKTKKQYRFSLPCPAFTGTCSIYSERPLICREHECDLLQSVASSQISLDDAQDIIKKTQTLINEIVPELSRLAKNKASKSPIVLMRKILNGFQDNHAKNIFMEENKGLFLKYGIFNYLKHKYFYHRDKNFHQL